MRLSGIFKSFLHRRTKSCPSILPSMVTPTTFDIVTAAEAPDVLNEPAARSSLIDQVFSSATRSRHSDGSLKAATNSPTLAKQVLLLQSELVKLKETNVRLYSETEKLEKDVTAAKSDLHAERCRHSVTQRQLRECQDDNGKIQEKLGQLERFTARLVEIGLQNLVLSRARDSVLEGEDADSALVDAIKEAASNPSSPWQYILDAVKGPRTQDEYISALNMTLAARRALRDSKKITKFWKGVALEDETHADIVTPSPSNISSIHEFLSEERQIAVNELLGRLRSGTLSYRRTTASPRRPRDSLDDAKLKTLSRLVEPSSSSRSLSNSGSFPSSSSTNSASALAPLASQVFKEELMASHSSRKLLKSISRSSGSIAVTVSTSSISGIGPSSTGSLKEWTMVESAGARLDETSFPSEESDMFAGVLTEQLLAADTRVNVALREEKASRVRLSGGPQPFDNSAFAKLIDSASSKGSIGTEGLSECSSQGGSGANRSIGSSATDMHPTHDVDDGGLSSAKALCSLERICAALRAGSELGSLETISERTEPESEYEWANTQTEQHAAPVRPTTDEVPLEAESEPAPVTTSPSRLPVFKGSKQSQSPISPFHLSEILPSLALAVPSIFAGEASSLVAEGEPCPAPVKQKRMSLIPRNTNRGTTTKLIPPKPVTSSLVKPTVSFRQPAEAVNPANQASKRKKASTPTKSKENNVGNHVLLKGKKVIRGLHRAVS